MRIAVEGCAHGELNKIYESIRHIETRENWKVDLLICCGDFQSVRDHNDMLSMAVPKKYMEMKDFCDYYTGKRIAPILTLFIGGNHEASNYLWELPYGGWVAENIYYLGYSGVVNFGGIRIGGISGIFKKKDYYAERSESPPFNENTKRSIYHVRKRDVEILKLLRDDPPDIFLSHDWPTNIYNYGNVEQLLRFKPFLKEEIEANTLGNEGAEEILNVLQPAYWFSGHMHAKFAALVQHPSGKQTKFLALDKCLPRRNFLQILDFGQAKGEAVLKYDINWLGILKTTSKVMSILELNNEHKPSEEILDQIRDSCTSFEVLPFSKSFNGNNTQTLKFCEMFDLANPCITKSWNTIKKSVVDNAYRSRPKPKMSLPQPGEKKAVPKSENSLKDKKQEKDDDEFGEITNPNMLSNVSDSDDAEESNGSSSGSSSSSDDDDDRKSSSDRGSDNDNRKYESFEKYERNTSQSPPSFIETPQNVKTINSRLSMQSDISTPFKWKSESNNMRNKTLSFNVSPLREKTADFEYTSPTSDSAKIAVNKNLNIEKSASSTPTQIVPEGEVTCDGGNSLANHLTPSPKKKFKLIRRNQSIYTPSKEEE